MGTVVTPKIQTVLVLVISVLLVVIGVRASESEPTPVLERFVAPGSEPIVRSVEPPREECDGLPVHLSFDDGPSVNTEQVLNVLREENVRATFFLAGEAVDRSPFLARQMIRRQIEEGHQIAYHGYQHGNYTQNPGFFEQQIDMTRERLAEFQLTPTQRVSDFALPLLRLPGGDGWVSSIRHNRTPDAVAMMIRTRLRQEGWSHFGWHIDTKDYQGNPMSRIDQSIRELEANGGGVVLLHDIHNWSEEYTRQFIGRLKDQGYCFQGPEYFMMDESLQIRLRGESETCGWR